MLALLAIVISAFSLLVALIVAVRSERRETAKKLDEENDFAFLAAFMEKQLEVGDYAGQIFVTDIEVGSETWKRAEKLAERGVLKRGLGGRGYRIAGFEDLKPARL